VPVMTMRSMSIVEHGGNFTYEGRRRKFGRRNMCPHDRSDQQCWAPMAVAEWLGACVERGVFAHNLMGAFQSGINHVARR